MAMDLLSKIVSQLLGAVTGQGRFQPIKIFKCLLAPMHGNIGAVPRERHQGGMTVKIGVRQDNGAVHGGPLQLVGGGGVTVVDMDVILNVKDYASAVITPHLYFRASDTLHFSEVSVFYPYSRIVL
jgi:hypothetical protein